MSSRRWALKRESYENRSAVSVHVGQSDHRGQLNVSEGLTHTLLNSVISNDLELSSKTFNDTERCAVSLQQLSFLSKS